MFQAFLLCFALFAGTSGERNDKQFSVFNVIRFPNDICTSKSNLNGTCYTATECTSLGGTSSGSCASSFGVCCVFNLACGATTTANNSYATISSYSVTTDADPCTYTYCKTNDDVCKLKIDYDSMVIADPDAPSVAAGVAGGLEGPNVGDCNTDTLTVGTPGFTAPPIICGYNTGQHMWVPVCPACVTITIDIDTGNTATTRNWNIRVSQYECGADNLIMPEENCLQYHTAQTGRIASFNWDTSTTSAGSSTTALTNAHLSSQDYDICIRRARGYCSICFDPVITTTTAGEASSYGISAGDTNSDPAGKSQSGTLCWGISQFNAIVDNAGNAGFGDYLDISNIQNGAGTATALGFHKMCGTVWNQAATIATHATICTWAVPFRIGVHFDELEIAASNAGNTHGHIENEIPAAGEGIGYTGFWLNYWQNTC